MITITKQEFLKLAEYIKQNYGIHLKEEKQTIFTSRLYNELVNSNCKNFTQYYEYILSDKSGRALISLINKITTNHTFFEIVPASVEIARRPFARFLSYVGYISITFASTGLVECGH